MDPPSPTTPRSSSSRKEDRLVGAILDRRYRVGGEVGRGGIGIVYEAEHIQLQRRVAVKVLHSIHTANIEYRSRFEREALAASKANHPGCVAVLDLGTTEDKRPYIVMEFAEGQLLTERLANGQPDCTAAVDIICQVLRALGHAHHHGIVHRDVKPDNIMLCTAEQASSRVKLLDFGLAKNLISGAPGSQSLTKFGTVFGTPSYMSPEQCAGAEADTRTDLYSVGVVLFEAVCGRKPFISDDPYQRIQAHIKEEVPSARQFAPNLSRQLDAVISRALVKDRDGRFQTAEQFVEAILRAPEAEGLESATGPRGSRSAGDESEPRRTRSGARLAALGRWVRSRLARTKLPPVRQWLVPPAVYGVVAAEAVIALVAAVVLMLFKPDPFADFNEALAAQTGLRWATVQLGSAELKHATRFMVRGDMTRAEFHARRAAYLGRQEDGFAHLLLGHIYHGRGWAKEGIDQYRSAVELQPELAGNSVLLINTARSLGPLDTRKGAAELINHWLGTAALPILRLVETQATDQELQRRVRRLIQQIKEKAKRASDTGAGAN